MWYGESLANEDITYVTIIAMSGRKIPESGDLQTGSANVNKQTTGKDISVDTTARWLP